MPKPRRQTKRPQNYPDDSSDADEDYSSDADEDFSLMSSLLNIFASQRATRIRRKTPNKKNPAGTCAGHHCCSRHNRQPAKKSMPRSSVQNKSKQSKSKQQNKTQSTSTQPAASIDLDSDNEVSNAPLTETHVAGIQQKVNTFFKALESDDEDSDEVFTKKPASGEPSEAKSKDFYTILSDSDGEAENQTLDCSDLKVSTIVTCESGDDRPLPSTSRFNNHFTMSNATDNNLNATSEKKSVDLFSYVDDILNECDVIDLDRANEPSSTLSLDDLKKKANAILDDVASYAVELQTKEPEKKDPTSPVKEVPNCPVCLETLGGTKQAMATLCGHIFCKQCLSKVMTTTKKCPSCRVKLTKAKYHPIYI